MNIQMEASIRGAGPTIKGMGEELSPGLMDPSMKVNGGTVPLMEKGYIPSQMDRST